MKKSIRQSLMTGCVGLTLAAAMSITPGPDLWARTAARSIGKKAEYFKPFELDGKIDDKDKFDVAPGLKVYEFSSGGWQGQKFCVYVPKGYTPDTPIPLVVSFHGNGGTPEKEAKEWGKLPDEGNYVLVCLPGAGYDMFEKVDAQKEIKSVAQAYEAGMNVNRINAAKCHEAAEGIFRRILGTFNIDRRRVLATGYSGGGQSTWRLGWGHPEFFTALCFRAANVPHCLAEKAFTDFYMQPELIEKWRSRPIYVLWGEKDHPMIVKSAHNITPAAMENPCGEGPFTIRVLREIVRAEKLTHEIVPGGGHDSRPDLASKWFVGTAVAGILSFDDGVTVEHCKKELAELEAGTNVKKALDALRKYATTDDARGGEAKAILGNAERHYGKLVARLTELSGESPARALNEAERARAEINGFESGRALDELIDRLKKTSPQVKNLAAVLVSIEKLRAAAGDPSKAKKAQRDAAGIAKKIEGIVKIKNLPEHVRREAESALREVEGYAGTDKK